MLEALATIILLPMAVVTVAFWATVGVALIVSAFKRKKK